MNKLRKWWWAEEYALPHILATISAKVGGNAFPTIVQASSIKSALILYDFGNVCINAASLTEIVLNSSGCPNLPFDRVVHPPVIVGGVSSQANRPYTF